MPEWDGNGGGDDKWYKWFIGIFAIVAVAFFLWGLYKFMNGG